MSGTPPSLLDARSPRPARRPELVAIDADGTSVCSDGSVRPAIRQALLEVIAARTPVLLLTGRMYAAAVPAARALGISEPVVCDRGAVIRHLPAAGNPATAPGAAVREMLVAGDLAEELVANARLAGWHLQLTARNRIVADRRYPGSAAYERLLGITVREVADLAAEARAGFGAGYHLLDSAAEADRCEAVLRRRFAGRLDIARSEDRCVEVHALGASKAAALEYLCRTRYGISLADVLAVDDSDNGRDMVASAGFGVGIEGGSPRVLEVARLRCPPPERDGLAVLLRGLGLTRPEPLRPGLSR